MQERMDTEGIIYHEPTDSERNLLSFGPYGLLRSRVSKWALLATRDPGFLGNPAPVHACRLAARRSTGFLSPSSSECLLG